MVKYGSFPNISQLTELLRRNIYEPVVNGIYDEFISYGILDECVNIYRHIPDEQIVEILTNVQATQVNHEKALWPVYVAKKTKLNVNRAIEIGAATDILWSLSTIMDDIVDGDKTRNGKPTVWENTSMEIAEKIAYTGLTGVLKYLEETNEMYVAQLAERYVKKGMDSLTIHQQLGLSASIDDIFKNYHMRDDFHSAFPFHALYKTDQSVEASNVITAMRIFNQAGQILNDLSDVQSRDSNTHRLSDLRTGRVSVIIKLLHEQSPELIERCFGQESISDSDATEIDNLVRTDKIREKLEKHVKIGYQFALEAIGPYVCSEDMLYFRKWVQYKLKRLDY